MVGTERVLLPILAGHDFGLKARVAILSFLISFGLVKAAANSFAGRWSDRVGRKPVLLAGWLAFPYQSSFTLHPHGPGWSLPTSCWVSTRVSPGRQPST